MNWRFVSSMVPLMNDEFLAIHQIFLDVVSDTSPMARWKTCVTAVDRMYKFVTGRMYIDDHFSEDAKSKMQEMISNLQTAFKSMVATTDWLQAGDKVVAAEKADAMKVAIGYPDWIKDNTKLENKYKDVSAMATEYFKNSIRYKRWVSKSELALLRQDVVDNGMWSDTPPTMVNAYYDPSLNGIMFPAGILNPPFYHKDLPWFSNYGAIGVVIGHEITHGFDNNGRRYDKNGNRRVWWTQTSIDNFVEKTQCIIDQYSDFTMPENNRNLNGAQTQDENIADNGGLRESYKAYKDNIPKQPRLPGLHLTEEQMFFLSFSQVWCSVFTPKGADNIIDNNSHSPDRYRVIGPLQNNEAFHAAFKCKPGSYMNPGTKCRVW